MANFELAEGLGKVWRIRHANGLWRTLDTFGMLEFTDNEADALGFTQREHADRFAADDPEDVDIVQATEPLYTQDQVTALQAKVAELDALINNPHVTDFLEAVRTEAAHQVQRWGTAHDRAKTAADWFWLLGYLGGKALRAAEQGDLFKAKHHTISSAAALLNWHAALADVDHRMAPGSSDIQQAVEAAFGPNAT